MVDARKTKPQLLEEIGTLKAQLESFSGLASPQNPIINGAERLSHSVY